LAKVWSCACVAAAETVGAVVEVSRLTA